MADKERKGRYHPEFPKLLTNAQTGAHTPKGFGANKFQGGKKHGSTAQSYSNEFQQDAWHHPGSTGKVI